MCFKLVVSNYRPHNQVVGLRDTCINGSKIRIISSLKNTMSFGRCASDSVDLSCHHGYDLRSLCFSAGSWSSPQEARRYNSGQEKSRSDTDGHCAIETVQALVIDRFE